MSFLEKSLLFQDFLFVANYSEEGSLKVDVRHLQKTKDSEKDPKWMQYDTISLALNLSQSNLSTIRGPVLLFENVEDSLSGIVRPTLLIHFCGDSLRQSFAYILVLIKDKTSSDHEKCTWKIKPIKKLKTTLDKDPKNLNFVNQCSFIYSRNERLYFCDEEGEHTISFTKDKNVQNIICMASKKCQGTSILLGASAFLDDKNISDDQDLQYRIFALKKPKFCKNEKLFEVLDPTLFLSDDYASCITRIYIHFVEEICHNVINTHGQVEKHPSTYQSHIFLILNHGYLLEFANGRLKTSLYLVNIYRELNILEYNEDDNSLNFDISSSIIRAAIDLDKNRKMIILQHDKVCIAVDTQTEKVHQYWQDINYVLIDDVLKKGRDQLLLVSHPQWYLTDFNTVYIDYLNDEPDPMMCEDDGDNSATARNALQQQLTRMSLSVEQAERRLKEKIEFVQSNLSRLQKTASKPRSLLGNPGINEKNKEIFKVEIKKKWYKVINDCLVIGLHVINTSSHSISNLSLSITCGDSFNIFKSSSKQFDNDTINSTRSSATSKSTEQQTLKKIKLLVPGDQCSDGTLAPKDETVLTGYFEISQLSDAIKGQVTLSLYLHFSPWEKEDVKEFCIQNGGKIQMNFKEFFDNSFTESIVTIPTFDKNSGQNLHHGLLCLNTIQHCFKLVLHTKYGYINLIADWLKKIPGLVYYEYYNCYMFTLSGALYLCRMEVDLKSDFKHVQVKLYARSRKQFELFKNFISSYLPQNVSYKLTANQNQEFLIQKFLTCASEEIKTGLEFSQLSHNPVKDDGIFEVDFHKQENVFKFHAAFDKEKKELCQAKQTAMFLESDKGTLKKLKDCEKETDSIVEKIGIKNI
ncbi:hypothetical protein LOTGIDRAFT_172384 [Lottia gigantea]|uniref:Uncharacterized protein n=1 Tax=Lottia gigantea TaxID=225164 RepID=V4B6X3_LOTGI|nr:hypothetical protein LOTGIDRAFT_172384 [Lottia gigantea]ESP01827.1 hypothetical protein LOTGIDRAFT_172384 [Lottia gigantea]